MIDLVKIVNVPCISCVMGDRRAGATYVTKSLLTNWIHNSDGLLIMNVILLVA